MARPFLSSCLLICLVITSAKQATAQISDAPVGNALREPAELPLRTRLRQTRRVGRLRAEQTESGEPRYVLRDAWDNRTYEIETDGTTDLQPYVNRYVALHGQTDSATSGSTSGPRIFHVEKVVRLDRDGRHKGIIIPNSVRQVDFQDGAADIQPQLPGEGVAEEIAPELEPVPLSDQIEIPLPQYDHYADVPFETHTHGDGAPCQSCGGTTFSPWAGAIAGLFQSDGTCCGTSHRLWVRGEYLLWWTDGLRLPPLVTSSPSGTQRSDAGVLGVAGTTVLNPMVVNNDAHSGARFRAGWWLFGGKLGLGGDYYFLDDQVARYASSSTGDPILARPFFDVLNGQETAELVAFPNVVRGTVAVESRTEFRSGGVHARINACCSEWQTDCCNTQGSRVDWLVGYRYMRLKDGVRIREDLTSLDTANPGQFLIEDRFRTKNTFHGIEFGVLMERQWGRWMLEWLGKVALGNNRQRVDISGFSVITEGNTSQQFSSGILTQRTNIGSYERDEFAMVPELGVTLGYQMAPNLRLTVGYTLVYFSNVVRAGDQIDRDVNPNLFPPEVDPFVGPLRPTFAFRDTDFWAHGLNIGGDFRW